MSSNLPPFRIDILDVDGKKVGDGPIITATRLTTAHRLDAVGSVEFSMPTADPRAALLQSGCKLDVYVQDDPHGKVEHLGEYPYRTKSLNGGQWTVGAWDALYELTRRSVYFSRSYVNQDVAAVIADLVGVVPGWTAETDGGIGNTSVTYEGEHVLPAIDELRDRWGQHFRLKTGSKTLQFGAFGADSGVVLTNLPGQVPPEIARRRHIAIIPEGGLQLVEETDEVFNRAIALGGGVGETMVTLELATPGIGDYTVQEGTNKDGSKFWYIEDAASIANHGLTEKILKFDSIRPITNSDTNRVNAANAVQLAAEAIMKRHLDPKVSYGVQVADLRQRVLPGDTVRLIYRGVVERTDGRGRYASIDVDEDVYVMDVEVTREAAGGRSVRLEVSTIASRRTADSDVMIQVVRDLRAQRLHVQPSITKVLYGPYKRELDSTHSAVFTVPFGDEVLALNYAYLMIRTRPFRSTVKGAASGGGVTSSSGGGGTSSSGGAHTHRMFKRVSGTLPDTPHLYFKCKDANGYEVGAGLVCGTLDVDVYTYDAADAHTHTVADHTHNIPDHTHDADYGIEDDTVYPTSMGVKINGTDETSALGGPWATGGGAATIKADITDLLTGATGGLQQDHEIEVYCASSQGEVEVGVLTMETIQAIAVS